MYGDSYGILPLLKVEQWSGNLCAVVEDWVEEDLILKSNENVFKVV